MKKQKTVIITMRIPGEVVERINIAAKGNRSEFIRQAIDEKLARTKEQKPC